MSGNALDQIQIPVRIDRSLMALGTNRGEVVLNASGASELRVPVIAEDVLQVDFTASVRNPGIGEAVTFTNMTTRMAQAGALLAVRWDFGDGAMSEDENPTHVYAAPGLYTVSLRATTASLRTETLVREGYIAVDQGRPSAAFEVSSDNIPEGGSVVFTNLSTAATGAPITRVEWEFGDNYTGTDYSPTHQYIQAGRYTATLTVYTEFQSDSASREIIVRQEVPPRAKFTISQLSPYISEPVTFTNLTETGSAPVTQYVWNFGDGIVTREDNPSHTYTAIGDYTVGLTAMSADGNDQMQLPIHVTYRPPVAYFTVDETNPSTGDEVEFIESSSAGTDSIASWLWDFGDGTTELIERGDGVTSGGTTHIYAEEGTYTVSLTVATSSDENNTDIMELEDLIEVVDPPVPAFSIDDASAVTSRRVYFTNESEEGTEEIKSYEWNFGDPASSDNISTLEDPSHLFENPGNYKVTLTAITATRSVKSEALRIVVDAPPVPNFEAAEREGTTPRSDSIHR